MAENEYVFARIYQLSRGKFFLPQFVDFCQIFFAEFLHVDVAHTETQRHGLAFSVLFPADMITCARQQRQNGVARRVHKIARLQCFDAETAHHLDLFYFAARRQNVANRRMKQYFNAVIIGHVVHYDFKEFFVEGRPVAAYHLVSAVAFGILIKTRQKFGKKSLV